MAFPVLMPSKRSVKNVIKAAIGSPTINNIIDEIKAKKSELNNIPTESEQRDTNSINKIF